MTFVLARNIIPDGLGPGAAQMIRDVLGTSRRDSRLIYARLRPSCNVSCPRQAVLRSVRYVEKAASKKPIAPALYAATAAQYMTGFFSRVMPSPRSRGI